MSAGVIPASRLVPLLLAGIVALAGTVRVATAYVPDAVEVQDRQGEVEALEDRLAALEERRGRLVAVASELRSTSREWEQQREQAQRRVRRLVRELRELQAEAAALAA